MLHCSIWSLTLRINRWLAGGVLFRCTFNHIKLWCRATCVSIIHETLHDDTEMQPNSHRYRTSQLSKNKKTTTTRNPPIRNLIYVQNNMCAYKEKQDLNYNLWSLFDKILQSCYFVLMDRKMNSTEFIRVNSIIIIFKTGLQLHNLIAFDCQCVLLT